MSAELFQRILDEHRELSSLPQTLAEVLRVAKDEDSSAQDLAEVLRRDPSLTAKILRVVNSPFYGAGRNISSVRQAVVTLGMRAVMAIALSTSIYDLTDKWATAINRIRFWRHSLEVAVTSRMIAEAIGYRPAEEAFVSGLLHDIGLLVLEKAFPQEFQNLWKDEEPTVTLAEREERIWATNHARVGQFLLEQWNLPSAICEAIGRHHDDFSSPEHDNRSRLALCVALANLLSQFRVAPTGVTPSRSLTVKENLTAGLQLPTERLAQIDESHLGQTLEEAKFLEIDIGSQGDLLIEANRMLYQQYGAVERLLRENRQMQDHLALAELDKAALSTLKTISATFNHYINNAVGTILGRAQLVEVALQRGEVVDKGGTVGRAMQVIINGVKTIQSVVEELTQLTTFKTAVYHDDTHIIDIEKRLKNKLGSAEREAPTPR
ncbi:MAG TPA: HDOD domain-containing protein [Candidatus Deferrimicrobium sp.]|nr:HDOD domain-containing protein [Candidatus Deferrimicrobium sp.]